MGIRKSLDLNIVRVAKVPAILVSQREARRNVKLIEYSSAVKGQGCKKLSLLAAACHGGNVKEMTEL